MNFHVAKSIVLMAIALCNYTHASNAVGMNDLVTPTSVGGSRHGWYCNRPTSAGEKQPWSTCK